MILTVFLALIFCVAITLMMFAAVAFIHDIMSKGSYGCDASRIRYCRRKQN